VSPPHRPVSPRNTNQYPQHAHQERGEAEERRVADWKSLCDRQPEPLDDHVVAAARDLYAAGANAYVGRDLFEAPSLGEAVDAVREL